MLKGLGLRSVLAAAKRGELGGRLVRASLLAVPPLRLLPLPYSGRQLHLLQPLPVRLAQRHLQAGVRQDAALAGEHLVRRGRGERGEYGLGQRQRQRHEDEGQQWERNEAEYALIGGFVHLGGGEVAVR